MLVEGRDKRVEGDDWADVGVEAEGLADSDVERLDATTKWGCDGRLEEEAGALEAIPAILINTRGDTPLVHVLADLNHLGLDLCAGGIEDLEGRLHNLPGMYCCVFVTRFLVFSFDLFVICPEIEIDSPLIQTFTLSDSVA